MGSSGDPGARLVLLTHPADGAAGFARALVERRLAACVNLVPAASVYRWEGALESADERLLLVKTRAERVDELERFVAEAHPHDVPEFVVLRPEHVAPGYLAWLCAESGGAGSSPPR